MVVGRTSVQSIPGFVKQESHSAGSVCLRAPSMANGKSILSQDFTFADCRRLCDAGSSIAQTQAEWQIPAVKFLRTHKDSLGIKKALNKALR